MLRWLSRMQRPEDRQEQVEHGLEPTDTQNNEPPIDTFLKSKPYGGRTSGQYTDDDMQTARNEGERSLAWELWNYIDGYVAETEKVTDQILRESRQKLIQDLKRIAGGKPDDPIPTGARWPRHETKNLIALRMAAVKFWANYDPQDPGTAPTNAAVVEWLQEEHGIRTSTAEGMATILRADGLKAGPRPKN